MISSSSTKWMCMKRAISNKKSPVCRLLAGVEPGSEKVRDQLSAI
jgi:hypothetical protein